MKRYINAKDGSANLDQYTKVSFGRHQYSCHYNLIDSSPEADAHQMWLDFQASVSPIKPYDDADYAWASIKDGKINIIRNGKSIKTYYYFDADDMDVENTDWCDAVIDLAIQYLEIANKDVTPMIIHNSTNIGPAAGGATSKHKDVIESARDYGGAYDIDPSQYFTRDDITQFAEDVVDAINARSYSHVKLVSTYLENNKIGVTVEWDGNEVIASAKIDMRKIRKPKDIDKYIKPIADELIRQLKEFGFDAGPHLHDEDYLNGSYNPEPAEVTDFKNAVNSADTIDDIQFLIYELSDGVAEEACQVAFDAAVNSDVDDIDTVKHEVISAIDMYLEDNEFIEASQKLDASANKKLTKLKDEILSAVKDVMMSPNFGFLEDEVNEYSFVDVYPEGRVEVRAEVDYDGLMELVSALNPIIQKYDKDSYFEPVEPGIIEAYLHI